MDREYGVSIWMVGSKRMTKVLKCSQLGDGIHPLVEDKLGMDGQAIALPEFQSLKYTKAKNTYVPTVLEK